MVKKKKENKKIKKGKNYKIEILLPFKGVKGSKF